MPSASTIQLPALLPYALSYAKRGWPVFPLHTPHGKQCSCGKDCGNPGKHPRTKHGLTDATTDESTIRSWWTKWSDANIGIATGTRSGIVVVDVDPRSGGDATWERLQLEHDGDAPTLTSETGGGGLHVIYERPSDQGKIASRKDAIPPGVDCKADGGYIVAAPSLHMSGRRYQWRDENEQLQPVPAWLLAILCPQPKARPAPPRAAIHCEQPDDLILKRARAYLVKCSVSVSGQGGHDAAWNAAQVLVRGFDLAPGVALELLEQDFNPRCEPPWSTAELCHKISDANEKSNMPRGYLRDATRPGATTSSPPEENDWQVELARKKEGDLLPILHNAALILAHDQPWHGVLGYNSFSGRTVFRSPPPWHPEEAPAFPHVALEDTDEARLISWLYRRWGMRIGHEVANDALEMVCQAHAWHPVRDYLEQCRANWDGSARLSGFAPFYMGADPEAHYLTAPLRWMIAAVKRIYEPGCQSDSILVLEGEQGIGKSRFLRTLAGDEWFADEIGDISNKDSAEGLCGKWIIEIGELKWRKSDEDTRKAFISRRVDHYRAAYGRRTNDIPRQCVLSASTNNYQWQTDPSGARRYWVIACKKFDQAAVERDRDQLWGEAMARYQQCEPAYLQDHEIPAQVEALRQRREVDPWESDILEWCDGKTEVAIEWILDECLKIDKTKCTQNDARRVGAILRGGTWRPTGKRAQGTRGEHRPKTWGHV